MLDLIGLSVFHFGLAAFTLVMLRPTASIIARATGYHVPLTMLILCLVLGVFAFLVGIIAEPVKEFFHYDDLNKKYHFTEKYK